MTATRTPRPRPAIRALAAATALIAVFVLAGCSQDDTATAQAAATTTASLPSQHVHAIARDPGDGTVKLATHDGLFTLTTGGTWQQIGPAIDLMGFTVTGPGNYYASGHPDPDTGLPEPAGLLHSVDAGKTWTALSRGGQSDFHALTASTRGVVGFDGGLRHSSDGRSWRTGAIPAPVRSLGAAPDGARVLATTEQGVLASSDHGRTWTAVPGAPMLLLVAWADDTTAVGISPAGQVSISTDAGNTWRTTQHTLAGPEALSAIRTPGGGLEILAVASAGVVSSTDRGATFKPVTPAPPTR
ncbi:F510_1955 family glycosylhydrolase [Segeticoccus rhizosphaerae]|uniref:F510_1955 family glycosylhydrolase n=1 Tax=Segeticoccus rhizosphaerae TaxID=1104777 RepID=UPI001EE3E2E1|nr:sialidase family protein [Ornithinicoccus soli]